MGSEEHVNYGYVPPMLDFTNPTRIIGEQMSDDLKKLYDFIELKKCDENGSLSMYEQFEKMKNLGVI